MRQAQGLAADGTSRTEGRVMSPTTALVLLSFGVGALVVADHVGPRGSLSLRERADALRAQTTRAQETSASASRRARQLMDQWSAAEDAARKAGL